MKLIIGLGNPNPEYKNNRHNIGFQIIDQIAESLILKSLKLEKKFKAEVCAGTFEDQKIILAKPQTFMNNSGLAVKLLKTFYKIKPQDIIVIHDDIDLPIGGIRISKWSSSGGNKGVESIIKEIGTKNFIRVRIGIANDLRAKIPADKFVLQNFNTQDKKILKNILPRAQEAVKMIIEAEPLEKVQNKFN